MGLAGCPSREEPCGPQSFKGGLVHHPPRPCRNPEMVGPVVKEGKPSPGVGERLVHRPIQPQQRPLPPSLLSTPCPPQGVTWAGDELWAEAPRPQLSPVTSPLPWREGRDGAATDSLEFESFSPRSPEQLDVTHGQPDPTEQGGGGLGGRARTRASGLVHKHPASRVLRKYGQQLMTVSAR